jgi:hypothetical protein
MNSARYETASAATEAPLHFIEAVDAEVTDAAIGGDSVEAMRRMERARETADALHPSDPLVSVALMIIEAKILIYGGRISEAAVLWSRVVAERGRRSHYVDDVMRTLLDAEKKIIGVSG